MVNAQAAAAILEVDLESVLAAVDEGSLSAINVGLGETRELRFFLGELFRAGNLLNDPEERAPEQGYDTVAVLAQALCGSEAWVSAARVYSAMSISHCHFLRLQNTGEFVTRRDANGHWQLTRESVVGFLDRRQA